MSRQRRLGTSLGAAAVVIVMTAVWATPQTGPADTTISDAIGIDSTPVPLNPLDLSQNAIGDFLYAGGLALVSSQTDQLHGLSDVTVTDGDKLIAVGDEGILLEARLVLDGADRLVGLTGAHIRRLTGESGQPLRDKAESDAEGLTQLANGDRLVSFERQHRILLYPAEGGPPRRAPAPGVRFPANEGMEALAADPDLGSDAYVVGAESSGQTWTCRLSAPECDQGPSLVKDNDFGLVALTRLPGNRTAYLLRAWDDKRGSRIALKVLRSTTVIAEMNMARPLTIDNFEGLAAVTRTDRIRFYLLSDDNYASDQRTLLLAFDWRPR